MIALLPSFGFPATNFDSRYYKTQIVDTSTQSACCSTYKRLVNLDMVLRIATDAITLRSHHASAEFVKKLKSSLIPLDTELPLELDCRNALCMRRGQIGSPKPDRQRCVGFLPYRPGHQTTLFPSVTA